jgi:hypothetical protein
VCYTIPLVAAITTSFIWKKKRILKLWWLALMFYGGSLFGIIDHLWNQELLLISENWLKDLCLGGVITAGIILAWRVILALAKKSPILITSLRAE